MNYLIHVGLLLSACFLYYWFLLRSETHFALNRWVLLACIAASFALPLVTVPAGWSLRQAPQAEFESAPAGEVSTTQQAELPPGNAVETETAIDYPPTAENQAAGSTAGAASSISQPPPATATDWPKLFRWVYLAGLLVFGLHFLIQISLLLFRMYRRPGYEFDGFRIVELPEKIAPYSFWNRIFLNPADYDTDTFQQIVEHERIHIRQRHSLDIIFAELLVVVQWCNPFAWLYRWAIEQNLEFLTDSEMLRRGTDRVHYQMNLVRVSVPNLPQGLTSNYNQNFLKKRIQMMNVKQSTLRSSWKYLALIPLLFFSILQFNATAQTPSRSQEINAESLALLSLETSDPLPIGQPVPEPSVPVETVAVPAGTSQVPSGPLSIPEDEALRMANPYAASNPTPVPVFPENDVDRRTWSASIDGNTVEFFLTADYSGNHHMNTSVTFQRSELGDLPRDNMGSFNARRMAGVMTFRGIFEGNTGAGQFEFEPSDQLVSTLRQAGYGEYNWIEQLHFFLADFQPGFLTYLERQGYEPDHQKLLELMVFGFDEQSFQSTLDLAEGNGFEKPSLQKIIELHIFKVDEAFMSELARAGFPDLDLQDAIEASIHGLDAELIRELSQAGFENLRFRRVLEMAIHNVTPAYIADLRAAGYNPTARRVIEAKIHNVDASYAAELARAGFENLTLEQVIQARIHNLDADFVQEMASIGFQDLSFEDIIGLSIHKVDADYVRALREAGYDLNIDEVTGAAIHRFDPADARAFNELGYTNLSFDELLSARIHGLTPSFVESFTEFEFRDLSFDELMAFRIHGVTPGFIRRNWEDGDSPQDFISMKIHGSRR